MPTSTIDATQVPIPNGKPLRWSKDRKKQIWRSDHFTDYGFYQIAQSVTDPELGYFCTFLAANTRDASTSSLRGRFQTLPAAQVACAHHLARFLDQFIL